MKLNLITILNIWKTCLNINKWKTRFINYRIIISHVIFLEDLVIENI